MLGITRNTLEEEKTSSSSVPESDDLRSGVTNINMREPELMAKKLERLVDKTGQVNINSQAKRKLFVKFYDYSVILNMKWLSFFLFWTSLFLITFTVFGAVVSRFSSRSSKDPLFDEMMRNENITKLEDVEADIPETILKEQEKRRNLTCFLGVHNVGDGIFFAMETLSTIGYGNKFPNPKCPESIMIVTMMQYCSLILRAIFTGLFLAKYALYMGSSSIRFSRFAVISQRNGDLYLMIRIADPMATGKDIVEVNAFACSYTSKTQEEDFVSSLVNINHLGGVLFSFTTDGGLLTEFPLLWPTVLFHKIDKESPLYSYDARTLAESKVEIVLKISGQKHGNGGTIFSSTSYTSEEILWGKHFCHDSVLFNIGGTRNIASINQDDIDELLDDDTPRMSAQDLDKISKSEFSEEK